MSPLNEQVKRTKFEGNFNIAKLTCLSFLFLPFLLNSFRSANDKSNLFPLSVDNIIDFLTIEKSSFLGYLSTIVIKFSFLVLPILTITIFEMVNKKPFKLINFNETSIGKITKSVGRKFADIWYYLIHIIQGQFSFITIFLTLGLASINSNLNESFSIFYKKIFPLESTEFSATLILILFIFIIDFCSYWEHRISHTVPFLWELHEFHHSATEMTIISVSREIPLQVLISSVFSIPIRALTSLLTIQFLTQGLILPFILFTLNLAYDYFNNVLGHSSLKLIYPKPITNILMSPSLHWLHHSANPNHFNSNYGQKFVFWDKMFGSYLDHTHLTDIDGYGVKDSEYNKYHPIYSYAILPVLRLIRRGRIFLGYR